MAKRGKSGEFVWMMKQRDKRRKHPLCPHMLGFTRDIIRNVFTGTVLIKSEYPHLMAVRVLVTELPPKRARGKKKGTR